MATVAQTASPCSHSPVQLIRRGQFIRLLLSGYYLVIIRLLSELLNVDLLFKLVTCDAELKQL